MKLIDLAARKGSRPAITLDYEEWIMSGAVFSQEALDFMNGEMNKAQRSRTGHLSASSLGSCARQQQFTWIGLPQKKETADREGILLNGDFAHLKHQMAGLSAGYLVAAEVPIPENKWGIKGTMDGIHKDGSVVEFKSQNSFGFRKLIGEGATAKEEHIFQVGSYMLATGRDRAYIVYENKDNQEIKEFTVERTDELMERVEKRIEYLQGKSNDRELIEPLGKCLEKTGWEYKWCSYRDQCLDINTWAQAEKRAR